MKPSFYLLFTSLTVGACVNSPHTPVASAETHTHPPPAHQIVGVGHQNSALYLRDAYGRCLRLQLRIRVAGGATEQNGHLDVWEASNDQCAKREAVGPTGVKQRK
jgi:hypothetical protein